jgi:hypothetical protein
VTTETERLLADIASAVADGDEQEMPRLQAFANGLRTDPHDPGLLSAVIELLDEMSARRLARRRMFQRLRDTGVLDETAHNGINIADLDEG